jgi:hypothetical protein
MHPVEEPAILLLGLSKADPQWNQGPDGPIAIGHFSPQLGVSRDLSQTTSVSQEKVTKPRLRLTQENSLSLDLDHLGGLVRREKSRYTVLPPAPTAPREVDERLVIQTLHVRIDQLLGGQRPGQR